MHRSTIIFPLFQAVLVHTAETTRVRYFMDLLMEKRRPVMLVGNAGTGKTVLAGDKFASLDPDEIMVANVPFNYYTTSAMLQGVLEKPLEKKAGRNYGPPGSKKLIYFIDDMNMPEVRSPVQLYTFSFALDHVTVPYIPAIILVAMLEVVTFIDHFFLGGHLRYSFTTHTDQTAS